LAIFAILAFLALAAFFAAFFLAAFLAAALAFLTAFFYFLVSFFEDLLDFLEDLLDFLEDLLEDFLLLLLFPDLDFLLDLDPDFFDPDFLDLEEDFFDEDFFDLDDFFDEDFDEFLLETDFLPFLPFASSTLSLEAILILFSIPSALISLIIAIKAMAKIVFFIII
jgi:hypothetical protein